MAKENIDVNVHIIQEGASKEEYVASDSATRSASTSLTKRAEAMGAQTAAQQKADGLSQARQKLEEIMSRQQEKYAQMASHDNPAFEGKTNEEIENLNRQNYELMQREVAVRTRLVEALHGRIEALKNFSSKNGISLKAK